MSYSEDYPYLKKAIGDIDNFENIAAVIDRYFPSLFSLYALDFAAKDNSYCRYLDAFIMLIKSLCDCYTEQQIAQNISDQLNTNSDFGLLICNELIFSPPNKENNNRCMGLLEKIALGRVSFGEPLTLLDMIRAAYGMYREKEEKTPAFNSIIVTSLLLLQASSESSESLLARSSVIIVDCALDPDALPKWAVIKKKTAYDASLLLYCEMTLTELEISHLTCFFKDKEFTYCGTTSLSVDTTGYTALVWVYEHVIKGFYLLKQPQKVMGDFSSVLSHCLSSQAPISNQFTLDSDDISICSEAFRYCAALYGEGPSLSYKLFTDLGKLAWIIDKIRMGDISAVINTIYRNRMTLHDVNKYIEKADALNPMNLVYFLRKEWKAEELYKSLEAIKRVVEIAKDTTNCIELFPKVKSTPYCFSPYFFDGYKAFTGLEFHVTGVCPDNSFGIILLSAVKNLFTFQIWKVNFPSGLMLTLQDDERDLIVKILDQNPYIQHMEIDSENENHKGLIQAICDPLFFTFKRNHFLMAMQYLPSLQDDCWMKASEYWFIYLLDRAQGFEKKTYSGSDTIADRIAAMGKEGLRHFYKFLNTDRCTVLRKNRYGNSKPAFCVFYKRQSSQHSTIEILQDLFLYLSDSDNKFPFSVLEIENIGNFDYENMIPVLSNIANLNRFDVIRIADYQLPDVKLLKSSRQMNDNLSTYFEDIQKRNEFILRVVKTEGRLSRVIQVVGADKYIPPMVWMFRDDDNTRASGSEDSVVAYEKEIAKIAEGIIAPSMKAAWIAIADKNNVKHAYANHVKKLQDIFFGVWDKIISVLPNTSGTVFDGIGKSDMIRTLTELLEYLNLLDTSLYSVFVGDEKVDHARCDAYALLINKNLILSRDNERGDDAEKIGSTVANVSAKSENDLALDYYLQFDSTYVWPKYYGSEVNLSHATETTTQTTSQTVQEHVIQCNTTEQRGNTSRNQPIFHKIVTYESLADLQMRCESYGGFYNNYAKKEFGADHLLYAYFHSGSIIANRPEVSLLQHIFATYIMNAVPRSNRAGVSSKHIISQVTEPALQKIFYHLKSGALSSGFSEKKSGGFYTEMSSKGRLTLWYDEQYREEQSDPLVLNLDNYIFETYTWEGDYRQFALSEYLYDNVSYIEAHRSLHLELFNIFKNKPSIEEVVSTALKHVACDILLEGGSDVLKTWFKTLDINNKQLYTWGQLYYPHGAKAVRAVITKLHYLNTALGKNFFDTFYNDVLLKNENYTHYNSPNFYNAMDQMISIVKDDSVLKRAWLVFSKKHLEKVIFQPIDQLWNGFSLFTQRLAALNLRLKSELFDAVTPKNMLVYVGRLLECLPHLCDLDERQTLLDNFHNEDSSAGGIHHWLVHEGGCHYRPELELNSFSCSAPHSYLPTKTFLYSSDFYSPFFEHQKIYLSRIVSAQPEWSQKSYQYVLDQCLQCSDNDQMRRMRDICLWIISTRYAEDRLEEIVESLRTINRSIERINFQRVAEYFSKSERLLAIDFDAMFWFINSQTCDLVESCLAHKQSGAILEYISLTHKELIYQKSRFLASEDHQFDRILDTVLMSSDLSDYFFHDGLKLIALFNQSSKIACELNRVANTFQPIVKQEVRFLIKQLQSLYDANSKDCLSNYWTDLLQCIDNMQNSPGDTESLREKFIDLLQKQGFCFSYDASGKFTTFCDLGMRHELAHFPGLSDRLSKFFDNHLAIDRTNTKKAEASHQALIAFFKKLQSKKNGVNELDIVLSHLEKAPKGHYWSTDYLLLLLKTLDPEDLGTLYPLAILEELLNNVLFQATRMDALQHVIPDDLLCFLQALLKEEKFIRSEERLIVQLALREIADSKQIRQTRKLTEQLLNHKLNDILPVLAKTSNFSSLSACFNQFVCATSQDFMYSSASSIKTHWAKTIRHWLDAADANDKMLKLLQEIQKHAPEKANIVLHIFAYSALDHSSTRILNDEEYQNVTTELLKLDTDTLNTVACYYPMHPSPHLKEIYQILINCSDPENLINILEELEEYDKNPNKHKIILGQNGFSLSNKANLERILKEILVEDAEGERRSLSERETCEIKEMLDGIYRAEKENNFLCGMSRVQRVNAFNEYSQLYSQQLSFQQGANEGGKGVYMQYMTEAERIGNTAENSSAKSISNLAETRYKMWALLFAVTSTVTEKYPRLTQQIALIINDIIKEKNANRAVRFSIDLLSTGEGKTLFNALRAIWSTVNAEYVTVLTPKTTLANDDFTYTQKIFNYLNIPSAYIQEKEVSSARQAESLHFSIGEYTSAKIRYSTLSEYWGLLVSAALCGYSLEEYEAKTTVILDEFDELIQEGFTTLHNKAEVLGNQKDIGWFYEALLSFYEESGLKAREITIAIIKEYYDYLFQKADSILERLAFIEYIFSSEKAVIWLQQLCTVYERLKRHCNFIARESIVSIQQETFLNQRIFPLTQDNQVANNAVFSLGAHPLLATKLNKEANETGNNPNFYVTPMMGVITSLSILSAAKFVWPEVLCTSGSASHSVLKRLHKARDTTVVQMPTNAINSREWVRPKFFDNEDDRLKAMVKLIEDCFEKRYSFLIACKDDSIIQELRASLSDYLSGECLRYFDFYLNEEKRSKDELLKKKKNNEYEGHEQKQRAVGIVASGLGRGENLDVQVAIILQPDSFVKLIQTGGRVGRDEPGFVYQLYLEQDLYTKEQKLIHFLRARGQIYPVSNDSAERIATYQYYSEYCADLDRDILLGERLIVDQFSRAFLLIIGKITESEKQNTVRKAFLLQREKFDNYWSKLSSNSRLQPVEKVSLLKTYAEQLFNDFLKVISSNEKEVSFDVDSLLFSVVSEQVPDPVLEMPPYDPIHYEDWPSSMSWIPIFVSDNTDIKSFEMNLSWSNCISDLEKIWLIVECLAEKIESSVMKKNFISSVATLILHVRDFKGMRLLLKRIEETKDAWYRECYRENFWITFWVKFAKHAEHFYRLTPLILEAMKQNSWYGFQLLLQCFDASSSMGLYADYVFRFVQECSVEDNLSEARRLLHFEGLFFPLKSLMRIIDVYGDQAFHALVSRLDKERRSFLGQIVSCLGPIIKVLKEPQLTLVQLEIIVDFFRDDETQLNITEDSFKNGILEYVRRSQGDPLTQKRAPVTTLQQCVMSIVQRTLDKNVFFTLPSDDRICQFIANLYDNHESILKHLESDPAKYALAKEHSTPYFHACISAFIEFAQSADPADKKKQQLIAALTKAKDIYCEAALSHDRTFSSKCGRLFMVFWANLFAAILTFGVAHVVHYKMTGNVLFFSDTESVRKENAFHAGLQESLCVY